MNTTDRSCLCIGGTLDGQFRSMDGRMLAAPRPQRLPMRSFEEIGVIERDLYRPEILSFMDGQQRYFWLVEGMTVLEATDRLIEFYRPGG